MPKLELCRIENKNRAKISCVKKHESRFFLVRICTCYLQSLMHDRTLYRGVPARNVRG